MDHSSILLYCRVHGCGWQNQPSLTINASAGAAFPLDGKIGKHISKIGIIEMPDLNALIIFARVVESNGFSEAARRLRMPVSTVSRRIAELEEELGARLLERSTRCLRLTDIGVEIQDHARRAAELNDVVGSIVSKKLTNNHRSVAFTCKLHQSISEAPGHIG
jgi:DNA-binding MarR family transcriptional regulator